MMLSADPSPRVVISHPGSPVFAQHDVMALDEHGMLEYFATSYLDHPSYALARAFRSGAQRIRPSWLKQLERRAFHEAPFDRVRTRPLLELFRTFLSLLNAPVATDLIWELQEHDFDRWVARGLTTRIDAVYTFEHAALATLRKAKRLGIYTFLEQPAQHSTFYAPILNEQIRRYPEIANSVSSLSLGRKGLRRDARKDAEIAIADCILCNSSFTRSTLVAAGAEWTKIEVTPYGFPPVVDCAVGRRDRPVVFLNAGTQSVRKGVHLLYRAWRELRFAPEEAELWLIGKMLLPESLRRDLPGRVRILDSVPHRELLQLYGQASVFVLPSLADGFGMVISEAMSRGLPVIATDHTGAVDVIENGRTGFIIPAGSEAALTAQMRWCVENADRLSAIGAAARARSAQWQWSDYRRAVANVVERRIAAFREADTRISTSALARS